MEHLLHATEGVRIKGIPTIKCDACAVSKAHRMVRREPRAEEAVPARTVALDFHDYTKDMQGYCSSMLVTDRASGYIWDYYFTSRTAESIIKAIAHLQMVLQTQFDLKIAAVQSDNEIVGQKLEVKRFLENQGIRLEPSAEYTQAQNGAAERSGGVIKQKMRSMKQGAHLPEDLWVEISKAAVYLHNRVPKYQYNWKTPYERLHLFVSNRNGAVREH